MLGKYVFCVCAAMCVSAAENPFGDGDIQSALDMARAAPGEFAADALLRLAALPNLSRQVRTQAIEDAFRRAAEAQQPLKRVNSMPYHPSNAAFEQRAFAQDVDALSLRTRAVQAMLPLDPAAARRMFSDMPPLDIPPVLCDEVMVFDVSSYYDTLARIVQTAFSPKELAGGAAAQFVAQRMARLGSPAEVAPAARALRESRLDDSAFALGFAAYAAALKHVWGDDRAFTFYLPEAGNEAQALASEAGRRKISPLPLIRAFRLYLVVNFSAVRCADDDLMAGGPGVGADFDLDQRSKDAIRFFNEKLRQGTVDTIEYAEAVPKRRSGAAAGMRACESDGCVEAARRYKSLIYNEQSAPLPTSARQSTEWHDKFEDAVDAVTRWEDAAPTASGALSSSGGSFTNAGEQFREKCSLYLDLASIAADSALRQTVLTAFAAYLQRARDRAQSRIEWLLPVSILIGKLGIDPTGWAGVAGAFVKSQDPLIALYLELEKAAPRSPAQVFSLM